jgi:hypothetical protein
VIGLVGVAAGLERVCGILMFGCGRSCSCMIVMI